MKIANNWKDYKILDMAEGQKLEKWGEIILSRPDPQIIWKEKHIQKMERNKRSISQKQNRRRSMGIP